MNDATVGVEGLVRNGGALCLDFINTVEPRTGPVSREWLTGYPDLVTWARYGGLVDEATADALLRTSAARPSAAQAAFRTAIDLREGLFRLFAAIVHDTTPTPADLDLLGRAFATATRHGRLAPHADRFDWTWDAAVPADASGDASGGASADPLGRPWWPVVASAMELLTHGPLDRIKQCPTDEGCSWLFLDATKNRSRRWCSMDDCGSLIKARRQTDKRRTARQRTRT
ncbi:CGNR zinc finger domain-containing protein [Virgisporangium ochraceum]|nr:ABATE domain-containing protein [Virgisporangium ochraceum]